MALDGQVMPIPTIPRIPRVPPIPKIPPIPPLPPLPKPTASLQAKRKYKAPKWLKWKVNIHSSVKPPELAAFDQPEMSDSSHLTAERGPDSL